VDYIRGISPAIAIEQKVSIKNNWAPMVTSTEILRPPQAAVCA
jgi:excinuclease ABC subunit A